MAIANGTCISFCYQPKAHYLATSRESRRYVVAYSRFAGAACRHLATSREYKAHFGLPWVYAPGTIGVSGLLDFNRTAFTDFVPACVMF